MSSAEPIGGASGTARQHRTVNDLPAIVAAVAYLLLFADGVVPQVQMLLLGGELLISNVVAKILLLMCVVVGIARDPRIRIARFPLLAWALCLGYLFADFWHLLGSSGLQSGEIVQTYNAYYFVLLVGPATLVFRGRVSERLLTRSAVWFLVISATIGTAQTLSGRPLLYTESADGTFVIQSWEFFDQVRAFSLFSSGLHFGFFCAFCGALGVAVSRDSAARGVPIVILSAIACYTTLTRACYLVFCCACAFSALIAFGRKPMRGLLLPVLYWALAVGTILGGMCGADTDPANDLQSAGSLVARIIEWTYYGDILVKAPILEKLFGLGLIQHDSFVEAAPLPIDNLFLALALHIGFVGLLLFLTLMTSMWLYLRREAIVTQSPFIIAAASLCATFPCSGTFNIMFISFGATLGVAIICERKIRQPNASSDASALGIFDWAKALLMPARAVPRHQE